MVNATLGRNAHLGTVIEFDVESDPRSLPPRDRGERAMHVRKIVRFSGAAAGVLMAAAIVTGVATGPTWTSPSKGVEPAADVDACTPVGAPAPVPYDPSAWCAWPAPTSAADEVALRAAADAAAARARAWARAHGSGSDGHQMASLTEASERVQRLGSP